MATSDKVILDINYDRNSPPFESLVESIETENQVIVDAEHAREIELLRSGLNCQYSIASEFAWFVGTHAEYDKIDAETVELES